MKESRHVLRYVMPGLLLAVQVVVFCLILCPKLTTTEFSNLQKDSGIVVIVGAVLASGVIGSILSTFHHCIHWHGTSLINHSGVLKRLVSNGILELRSCDSDVQNITRVQAWNIAVALWYERCSKDSFIGNADKRTLALTDQMHSMGTALVAAVLALIIAIIIVIMDGFTNAGECLAGRFILVGVISGLVISATGVSYHRIAASSQAVIDQVLYDSLYGEFVKSNKKVVAWVASSN